MITVVGCDGSTLPDAARAAVERATLVVGGQRHLDELGVPASARALVMGDVHAAVDAAVRHAGDVAVLASGDPGFFGIVRRLRAAGAQPVVHPAVSSVALAFARLGLPWDDALVVSAHGRDPRPALAAARAHRKVAVLTDADTGPGAVGAALRGTGRRVVVCERLGSPEERVVDTTPEDAARTDWQHPNLVLVLADDGVGEVGWSVGAAPAPEGWALPDGAFDHRDGMVTKAEVRALVLARLAPRLGTLAWDVGAGSGSVAVECARFGSAVLAIERDPAQCRRIGTNAKRHAVAVDVVEGEAPGALHSLPDPDAAFVGGGGADVVDACAARRPRRLVVALAALERVGPTVARMTAHGYAVEGTQVAASRLAALPGGTHRLAAVNPVVVLAGILT